MMFTKINWLNCLRAVSMISCFILCLNTSLFAQDVSVSGVVTDGETGDPVPGVTILVKGQTTGTVTDIDGKYTVNVPSDGVLVFSFVGYQTVEQAVSGRSAIDVSLPIDVQSLEEVVVVGYGTMERSNVTGAITTVDVEEVNKVAVPSAIEALRGQVAGLQVVRSSGQPGSPVTFKIRGNNSLGASSDPNGVGQRLNEVNQPIIVIDGVPIIGGNMAELNTADIESINVLKDAASASIYGSSGANGVVLITTKKGVPGQTKVTLNVSSGIVDLVQTPDVMNGDQFIQYKMDVFKDGDPNVPNPTIDSQLDLVEYENFIAGEEVDWLDEVLRTGIQTNIGVAVAGGSEIGNFYLSGNYFSEKGPIEASSYDRYSIRFNGDLDVNDVLTVGARVQVSQSKSDQRTRIVGFENDAVPSLSALVGTSPYGSVRDTLGNYTKFATEDLFAVNPLHKFNESEFDINVDRAYVNPYLVLNIIDGLTYTMNTFGEIRTGFLGRYQSDDFTDDALNLAQIREEKQVTYLWDNILNYTKDFGDHGLNVTAIYGLQQSEWTRLELNGRNIAADELGYWGLHSAPAAQQTIGTITSDWGRYYLAGRLGYNYAGRYSITATLRRDASSRFSGDNRFGYFPSVALAWNAQEEGWWFGGDTFNSFKLRVSYGQMGQDFIDPFSYQAGTFVTPIPGTADTGFRPGTVAGNPDLKWETSKQLNIGADFGLFTSRLTGSVEWFQTNTEDVLLYQQIPGPLNNGYSQYPSNIGETENTGLEITLKGVIIENSDFSWNASINWATNKSTIVRLNETGPNGEPLDNITNGWFIGQDFQEIYDFRYEGVYTTEEAAAETVTQFGNPVQAGFAKIADVSGPEGVPDGNIDFDDRTFLGNPTPSWYGGINNVISYKGITLTVLIEAVQGVKRLNTFYGNYGASRGNTVHINYWTPENENAPYPRVGASSPITGGAPFKNAVFYEDASFIALRNVQLSYDLPKKWLDSSFIGGVNIYARGYNLHYWTDYKNSYSPEITNTDQYPNTRNITFGARVTF